MVDQVQFKNLFKNGTEGDGSAPLVGYLPDWLVQKGSCRVFYNGPVGMWDLEHQSVNHWFDGLGMLTSFKLDLVNKTVHLKKRYLKSDAYHKATTHGKVIVTEYATAGSADPDKGVVSKLVSSIVPGEMTDNAACNIFIIPGSKPLFVAASETCLLRPFDPDTLEVMPKVDISSVVNIASSRPIVDQDTGDLYNLSATFLTGLKYHFIKFKSGSPTDNIPATFEFVSSISSRMTTCFSYYHTFGMSQNYLLMIEQPWVANSLKLIASKVKGYAFKDCLEWHPQEKNMFHVVHKSNGEAVNKTRYISSNAFFFLNIINCFEDGHGNLVVDIIAYDSPDVLDQMYLAKLRSNQFSVKDPAKILRYTLPLGQEVGEECVVEPKLVLPETGCECPRVNPNFQGKPYRFAYVTGWMNSVNKGFFANSLVKVDMETGNVVEWRGNSFCHPSEPVFLAKPGSTCEDEGLLIACVTDARTTEKDFIVLIDARNMTELARANFDETIPMSSHAFLNV